MKRTRLVYIAAFAIGNAISFGVLVAQSLPKLRDAPLPPEVRKDIIAVIVQDDKGSADDSQLQEIALDSSVSFLKLGQNGSSAIVVESDSSLVCGRHGNCPFYVFLNVKGRAVMVFQAVGDGPSVEPAIHHGMHDISWADTISTAVPDIAIEVDRYDGKAYNPAYCYHQIVDENGKSKDSPHRPCN